MAGNGERFTLRPDGSSKNYTVQNDGNLVAVSRGQTVRVNGFFRNELFITQNVEIVGGATLLASGALAQASGLSPAAITKVVDRLEAAGYVGRRVAPSDRRSQLLETSSAHSGLREVTWAPVIQAADAVLRDLDDDDLALLSDVLNRLARVSEDHARRLRAQVAAAPRP